MNAKLFPFVKVMQSLTNPVQERHRIAAVAIGYACACSSLLPSTAVENAEAHYRNSVENFSKRVISTLNEVSVIDTAMALDFARKFWLLRYDAVYKSSRMDVMPGDFFCSVFGVSKYFAQDTIDFTDTHAASIGIVYTHIRNVIADHFTQV
jgi:hypothetical protein